MKKKILSAIMAGIMVLGLAACSGGTDNKESSASQSSAESQDSQSSEGSNESDTPEAQGEKVLRMGLNGEPPNLDPQKSTDAVSAEVITGMLEGLIRVHEGIVQPGMAEKWEISDDGLTYTFHIRDNAKWNDGVPVTAKDFEYSIKRLLNPETAAEYAYMAYYIKGGEAWNNGTGSEEDVAVKALDDNTLEIVLNHPTKYFLSMLQLSQFLPSRQDIVEKHGQKYAADADKFVFNGPFIMTDWKHEEEVILVKNEDYWDKDNVKLSKIEMPIFSKRQPEYQMYMDGELDWALLDKDTMTQIPEDELQFYHDGAVDYFEINTISDDPIKAKLLNNKNFKKALGYAIDRKSYCEAVLKDGSEPALRFNLPLFAGTTDGKKFTEEYPLEVYSETADVEKAKELLNTALTEEGLTIDQIPTIELLTDDTESAKLQSEALQAMLKEIGVNIDIKQVPFKQRLELMQSKPGRFDIVHALWGPDYDDPMTYMDLWITGGGNNHPQWSNAKYDEYVLGAQTEVDAVKRANMLVEAEKILLDEAVIVPVYFRQRACAQRPYIINMPKNFYGAVRDYIYTDIDLNMREEMLGK